MGKRWFRRPSSGRTLRAMTTAIPAAAVLTLAAVSPALAADTTPPTVTAPVSRFATGATGTASASIRISWSSADDWTGVAAHRLQSNIDGGGWKNITLSSPTATSAIRTVSLGHRYQYRTRAADSAGNWSAWKTGSAFTFRIYQETSGNISYTGSWYTQSVSGASGGKSKYSNTPPGRAKFTISARAIGWVGMTCSYCGMAPVYVDGVYRGSVNTQWGTQNGQHSGPRIMYQRTWKGVGSHNLELRPEGTFLHPRVYIDAFYVLN
jgi:uncharacterized Zn-finger protein